jgi:Spy/CpxP family protein refolding chaperone
MKPFASLLFVVSILIGGSVVAVAQAPAQTQSDVDEQSMPSGPARDYGALLQEVFAPITDQLKLTKEQEFQIIAIITSAEVKSDPLVQRLDELDQQLSEGALLDSLDEARIRQLAAEEATLLTQMIAMKVRAKASIYRLLTPNQRTLVAQQFGGKSQLNGSLGAIGIY